MKWIFMICFSMLSFSASAQKIGKINYDPEGCSKKSYALKIDDPVVRKALQGAESYITSILGKFIVEKYIWFECFDSRQTGRGIFSTDFKVHQRLGDDTCFEFQYSVIDKKKDVIGGFRVVVDKNGIPVFDDYHFPDLNQNQLIRGFKRHFNNQFTCSFQTAYDIGKRKGFTTTPQLKWLSDDKFIVNKSGEQFMKIKYIWSFSEIVNGGEYSVLEINAETGKLESEKYIPRMPR